MTQGHRTGSQMPVVEGDANQADSFAACVRAALGVLGTGQGAPETDQTYLEGLSGAAFAPVYDEDEDCAAWWMEGGNDLRVDFMGRVLGFAAEASPTLSGPARREAREEYERSGTLSGEVADFWEQTRQGPASEAVIVQRTWPTWSVAVGWSDDLRRLSLSTMPGYDALCQSDPLFPTYVLRSAPIQTAPEEAERQALAAGARIAAGEVEGDGYHYGASLYEKSAARLDEGSFCAPCGGREWSCASRTLHRMKGTQRSAVGFLRRVGHFAELSGHPAELNGHLADAMERYEHMGRITDRHLEAHRVRESWDDELYRHQLKESFRHLARQQVEAGECLVAAAATLSRA